MPGSSQDKSKLFTSPQAKKSDENFSSLSLKRTNASVAGLNTSNPSGGGSLFNKPATGTGSFFNSNKPDKPAQPGLFSKPA